MKKFLSLILTVLLLVSVLPAQAASSVTYEGGAELFVFAPGSQYSDSDMFENFKLVMPGDVRTLTIPVTNTSGKQVRIWLRADPVSTQDRDFLDQLHIKVECKDETIFDAAASETAQLTQNTLLGTFKKDGSTELTVTLTVPIDLGNEFMCTLGIVPWTFVVEEIPEDDTPHTGDSFDLATWTAVGCAIGVSIMAIVLVLLKRRRAAEN